MTYINTHQRGLLYRRGEYLGMLSPGRHFIMPWSGYEVVIADTQVAFPAKLNLNIYRRDEKLMRELVIVDVSDNELVLRFADGRFVEVLTPGSHAFWTVVVKQEFVRVDRNRARVPDEVNPALHDALRAYIRFLRVEHYQKGLLFEDGVLKEMLEPGTYRFWQGPVMASIQVVDMRKQQMDISGQELMTRDKVTLRLNFTTHYRIKDVVKVGVTIKDFEQQLYILAQMILREYVGSLTLDELLQKKAEVGAFVLERLSARAEELGTEFLEAGVKDIILPGEIKDILNVVLVAEKKAQANIITRREETASTRSLLNTARLMDDNPTLYRLKELEFLERVSERIGNISLTGGGGLLEHLSGVLARQK